MDAQALPSEEDQFVAYKSVLEKMGSRPTVVRTLDIGGDKELSYLPFPHEMNPFLGYRAIRLCLDRTDIFKTQVRALLRSSVFGKLCIMFPKTLDLNKAQTYVLKICNTIKHKRIVFVSKNSFVSLWGSLGNLHQCPDTVQFGLETHLSKTDL